MAEEEEVDADLTRFQTLVDDVWMQITKVEPALAGSPPPPLFASDVLSRRLSHVFTDDDQLRALITWQFAARLTGANRSSKLTNAVALIVIALLIVAMV